MCSHHVVLRNGQITFPVEWDGPRRTWLSETQVPVPYNIATFAQKKQGMDKARTPIVDHYSSANGAYDLENDLGQRRPFYNLRNCWE